MVAAIFAASVMTSGLACASKSKGPTQNTRATGSSVLDIEPRAGSSRTAQAPANFDSALPPISADSMPGAPMPGAPVPGANMPGAPNSGGAFASQRSHTIIRGDTLWSISSKYYGDGKKFKDILAANPGLSESRLPLGKSIVIP